MKIRGFVLAVIALMALAFSVSAQDQTLVDIAAGNEDFSTLVSLVEAAGLTETLAGGEFTVFAPTNEAFAAIPEEILAYVGSNPELLTAVLTYHVVPAKVMSADVATGAVATVQGGELDIVVNDMGVYVDGATVTAVDIEASNGVIHVIDTVLLPEITLPEVDPLAVEGDILVAGSSTVLPVSERMANLFTDEGFAGNISVEGGGTGAGFEKFCTNAETDIADASRGIKDEEAAACDTNARPAVGFLVGIDALTVVVSKENTFVTDLTIEELAGIYNGTFVNWSDVRAEFPAEAIQIFSPGSDSGTFDFFVEAVLDKNEEAILNVAGIQLSEDDNVLVAGVESSPYAIGFFGSAYYYPNAEKLTALAIDGVVPGLESAEDGSYPLARPLYIYTSPVLLAEKPQLVEFINFYLTNVDAQLGTEDGQIGYFPTGKYASRANKLVFLTLTAGE